MCGPHAAEKGKLKNVESVFEDSLLIPILLCWIINSRWEGIWKFHEVTTFCGFGEKAELLTDKQQLHTWL